MTLEGLAKITDEHFIYGYNCSDTDNERAKVDYNFYDIIKDFKELYGTDAVKPFVKKYQANKIKQESERK